MSDDESVSIPAREEPELSETTILGTYSAPVAVGDKNQVSYVCLDLLCSSVQVKRILWDLSDLEKGFAVVEEAMKEEGRGDDVLYYGVKMLCGLRKYAEAAELLRPFENSTGALVQLAKALLLVVAEENLHDAEAVLPTHEQIKSLGAEERLEALSVRLLLWTEYGFYDKVSGEMELLQRLSEEEGISLRLLHKTQATVVCAALFLREFDIIKESALVKEYSLLPPLACNEIARIVLPYWASMVTLSHEYLPMLRNYHYGVIPNMVFRGVSLMVNKKERLTQPKLLCDLSKVCANMFCYDWVFDDQTGRTSFEPYLQYLYGYLEIRDELYTMREKMRKVWDISDSHDDLQGTGWILVSVASLMSVSEVEKARSLLAKAYYRCLWRQADKCDMLIGRQREMLPTRLLQLELYFIRAFQFFVCEKWEAFLYHHEQAMLFWDSFEVTRADSLERKTRTLPWHRLLCMLLCSYHMHHTLEHVKAIAAVERHRCMFLEENGVPLYNKDRPLDHIPPQTTVVYFVLILHLTEVWTSVKFKEEEYQNQVVPQLWCYNYYRKKSQGPGQGTLKLLPQVKDQALFTAQQWENAMGKEHVVLSSVHLAIKEQLDSIAGIYKTHAQRVVIVPEDSLCNTPWPSMPSSNQKWFVDMISANSVPALGFYSVNAVHEQAPLSESLLLSVRDHLDRVERILKNGQNELRIAAHHLKPNASQVFCDRPFAEEHQKPLLEPLLRTLCSKPLWRVIHITGTSNARRLLLADNEELTVSKIRSVEKFPKVDLVVLSGHKPFRGQTVEGPLGLVKALMERGVGCVVLSTVPISSKKLLQLFAFFYTLLEKFPNVAADVLLGAAMRQLRKTTNVFIEWGSFNICGVVGGQETSFKLEDGWKWPRLFAEKK